MIASWAPWQDAVGMLLLGGVVFAVIVGRAKWRQTRAARERADRAWRYGQDGVVAVEAAIILPVLLLLTLGGIDVGLYVVDAGLASSTASEVCRAVAAGEPHDPAILTPVSGGAFAVSVVLSDGWVEVEVTHDRPALSPVPGSRTLTRTASCVEGVAS